VIAVVETGTRMSKQLRQQSVVRPDRLEGRSDTANAPREPLIFHG
jgi:hypothetical protein